MGAVGRNGLKSGDFGAVGRKGLKRAILGVVGKKRLQKVSIWGKKGDFREVRKKRILKRSNWV